jgi:acetylornithine deacetylase
VPGLGAHANLWWRGVSALDKALVLKEALAGFQAERAVQLRSNPYFSDPEEFPVPALADTVWSLSAGHPDVMSPPQEAVLDFWLDALPGESLDDVIGALEHRLEAAADADPFLAEHRPVLQRHTTMRPFHPTAVPLDHPFVGVLAEGCRAVDGREPRVLGLSSVCDAMMFNLHSNTPAVVFGPGDLAVAHGPGEYIEIAELVRATRIIARTIVAWCGTS